MKRNNWIALGLRPIQHFLCFVNSPKSEPPRFGNLVTCFGRSCNCMYTAHMLKDLKWWPLNSKYIYPGFDDCDVKNENGEYVKLGHSQFRIALLWSCHCYWKYPFWISCVWSHSFILLSQLRMFKWMWRGQRTLLISISIWYKKCLRIYWFPRTLSQYRCVILPLQLPVNRLKIWAFFTW